MFIFTIFTPENTVILNMPWIKFKNFALSKHENRLYSLLLLNALSLGSLWVILDVTAHAYLLSFYAPKALYLGYIYAGVLVAIVFTFFFLSQAPPSRRQKLMFTAGVGMLAATLYIVYFIAPSLLVLQALFSVNILLTVLALFIYDYDIEKFIPARSRNIFFPAITAAKHIGIFGTSFIVLLILYINVNIKYIALFSIVFSVIFTITISLLMQEIKPAEQEAPRKSHVNTKNLWPLILSSTLIAFAGVLVHLVFLKTSYSAYPTLWGMIKVLTLFYGTMYLFNFLTRKYLIPRLLTSYDSPFSLIISPGILILSGLVFVIYYLFTSWTDNVNNYIFPLLGILLLKIVMETTKNSIDLPSLYVSLLALIKHTQSWQHLIIGACFGFAFILGGSFFLIYDSLFSWPIWIKILFILIGIAWGGIVIKLAKRVQIVLKSKTAFKQTSIKKNTENTSIMAQNFKGLGSNYFDFYKRVHPDKFPALLKILANYDDEQSKSYLLKHLNEFDPDFALQFLEKEEIPHNSNYQLVLNKKSQLTDLINYDYEAQDIGILANSNHSSDRIKAAQLLSINHNNEHINTLIILLRDIEPQVKINAIFSSRYYSAAEIYYLLVELLNSKEYYSYAFESLVYKGNQAIEHIEHLLSQQHFDDGYLFRIIKLYEKMATFMSVKKIIQFIDYPSRHINMIAVSALYNIDYKADDNLKIKLFNLIVRQSNIITWNISVMALLSQYSDYGWLKNAFDKELKSNYDDLFSLLNLLYPKQTMEEARMLINQNTSTSVSYASELLDSVLQEDLKKVILPIVSYGSYNDKIKKLQYYYTLEDNSDELFRSIISRDINLINPIIKAITIYSLPALENSQYMEDELLACLFHPNAIIRQTTSYVITFKYHYLLKRVFNRLPENVKDEVINMNMNTISENKLYLFIYKRLSEHNIFTKLKSNLLSQLAEKMHIMHYPAKTDVYLMDDLRFVPGMILVYGGPASLFINGEKIAVIKNEQFIFTELVNLKESDLCILRSKAETSIYCIEKNEFEKLCFDHDKLYQVISAYYLSSVTTSN